MYKRTHKQTNKHGKPKRCTFQLIVANEPQWIKSHEAILDTWRSASLSEWVEEAPVPRVARRPPAEPVTSNLALPALSVRSKNGSSCSESRLLRLMLQHTTQFTNDRRDWLHGALVLVTLVSRHVRNAAMHGKCICPLHPTSSLSKCQDPSLKLHNAQYFRRWLCHCFSAYWHYFKH
jgi:hypothetical protein